MLTWILLNFAWGALFVVAVVGIPLWLVIARPDTGPRRGPAPRRTSVARQRRPADPAQARRAWPRRPGPDSRPAAAGRCQLAALSRRGASTGRAAAGRSPAASS